MKEHKRKKLVSELNKAQKNADDLTNYLLDIPAKNKNGISLAERQLAEQQMFINGMSYAARILGVELGYRAEHTPKFKTVWHEDRRGRRDSFDHQGQAEQVR